MERLTNIWLTQTHRGGDALDGKTNKHRHKGGDTPDGKTNKHLATESQGGTHWTERLTIFWLPQTHRGGRTGRKD